MRVIVRFNLAEFAEGASIHGIQNLYGKLFLFVSSRAITTSANLTKAALTQNQEFDVVADEETVVEASRDYFDGCWSFGSSDLSHDMLDSWEKTGTRHRAAEGRLNHARELGERLQAAFDEHDKVTRNTLDQLDWPTL